MADPKPEQSDKANQSPMINPQEAKALIVFLNRVELKGQESDVHAALKHKLTLIMHTPQQVSDGDLGSMEGMKGTNREG